MDSILPIATMPAHLDDNKSTYVKLRQLRARIETLENHHNACFEEGNTCLQMLLEDIIEEYNSIQARMVVEPRHRPDSPTNFLLAREATVCEKSDVIERILEILYVHVLNEVSLP